MFNRTIRMTLSSLLAAGVLGCATPTSRTVETVTVRTMFEQPLKFRGKKVCVVGFLNFFRAHAMISDRAVDERVPYERITPTGFDHGPFYVRSEDAYLKNTYVKACGTVQFDKDCFEPAAGVTCIPKSILMRDVSIKAPALQ